MILLLAAGTPGRMESIPQDAYVWQRDWNKPVTCAVTNLGPRFGELIVLQAEVSWQEGRPRCVRARIDPEALRSTGRPVGLALRIGNHPGPFLRDDPVARYLADLCQELAGEARSNALEPAELHLDFDCAESKLDGYRAWLETLRTAVAPLPVTFTALPVWLNHDEFESLAAAADGYVLQIHSFERPKGPDESFRLCDPDEARRAVGRASDIGHPFRVALPTYGYQVAFGEDGAFLGLSSDGPSRRWPASAQVLEVRADAAGLSDLVREWSHRRPAGLTGLIWYRLPVEGETMNWPWPTLERVMAGEEPRPRLVTRVEHPQPGLVEIHLVNEGSLTAHHLPTVRVGWGNGRRTAADGLGGYRLTPEGLSSFRLDPPSGAGQLDPGKRITIGWARFSGLVNLEAQLDDDPN